MSAGECDEIIFGQRVRVGGPRGIIGMCPDHPGPLDDAEGHVCRVRPTDIAPQPRTMQNASRHLRVIE